MTRKDYKAIALAFTDVLAHFPEYKTGAEEIARRVAEVMEQDNPSFDRTRFLEACGL